MGIIKQTFEFLLFEHSHREIEGNFLCIGKHTVHVPFETAKALFRKYNIPDKKLGLLFTKGVFDRTTRRRNKTIYDHDFLKSFANINYHCLDISNYEGATIIHDMNVPVPDNLHQKFDFIYNGSCMDNVFDSATFIKNTSKMLKPGGRIMHIEASANAVGAYMHFSPEWFFSFYAINQYIDCKVYAIVVRNSSSRDIFESELFAWQPFFTRHQDYDYMQAAKSINGYIYLIVIAEKNLDSTDENTPIQMQCLGENSIDWRLKYHDFCKFSRPIFQPDEKSGDAVPPFLTDHYKYLGRKF